MRRPHPAQIALAAIAIVSLIALWSTVNRLINNNDNGFSWNGEPSDEVILEMALNTMSWGLIAPALGMAAAASVLGLVLIWCLSPDRQSSPRSTRTMSAAGSTENRTAVTTPNASPSISNSWGSPSIRSSTDRPRE
jgi:hypothetical protein